MLYKLLEFMLNCILTPILFPLWILWREHERRALLSGYPNVCDQGEPGA